MSKKRLLYFFPLTPYKGKLAKTQTDSFYKSSLHREDIKKAHNREFTIKTLF
jgi:hypothetical protein